MTLSDAALGQVVFHPSLPSLAGNRYWPLLGDALERRGVAVDRAPARPFSLRWLWANRSAPGVLHFHFVQQFYSYRGSQARLRWVARFARNLLVARMLGYRTAFTLHDLQPTWPLTPKWVDYLGHWCAANLTRSVIVHCDGARRALANRFGRREGVFVAPHPSYIGAYRNDLSQDEARTRLGLRHEARVFVFVGGIRPNKGIDHLIESFQQVEGDHLRLVLAGKPWPPLDHVRDLKARCEGDRRILAHFAHVPDDELQVYLNAADAIILPFSQVLTSGSLILAMSFGKAVVAPEMGCLPELVTASAGTLYDATRTDALRSVLTRYAELPATELHSMGKAAHSAISRHTWDGMAAQTLLAYGHRHDAGRNSA